MSAELSTILEHIERIERARPRWRRADLSCGHRRERAAPRRAVDEPGPRPPPWRTHHVSWTTASGCPARVADHSDIGLLSAAQAAEQVRAGAVSSAELFELYRGRAASEELGAFLHVEEPDALPAPGDGPLAGVPLGVKDLFCVAGVPSQAASRILEGYRPPYTATAVANLQDAGAVSLGKTNMDEFAMGSSNENSGFHPVRNPWDTRARARRLFRRLRRGRGSRARAMGPRHRHGRVDPPAGGALWRCRDETDLRHGLPLRHDRLRLFARPGGADHP